LLKALPAFVASQLRVQSERTTYSAAQVAADEDVLLVPFYAKRLFLPNSFFRKHGITLHNIEQRGGMAVIGSGMAMHQGYSEEVYGQNEAINFLPESWLVDGLPFVYNFLKYVKRLSKVLEAAQLRHKRTGAPIHPCLDRSLVKACINIVPRWWTFILLRTLYTSIGHHLIRKDSGGFAYTLSNEDLVTTQQYIRKSLGLLIELRPMYQKHDEVNDEQRIADEIDFMATYI
jgi:hypothetical protein